MVSVNVKHFLAVTVSISKEEHRNKFMSADHCWRFKNKSHVFISLTLYEIEQRTALNYKEQQSILKKCSALFVNINYATIQTYNINTKVYKIINVPNYTPYIHTIE